MNTRWESSPNEKGQVIVVELGKDIFETEGIRYFQKDSRSAVFVDIESAKAIMHAMTYFSNQESSAERALGKSNEGETNGKI